MKDKKGAEFAVGTVIMIVLGLVVLIILILVVRQQVTKGAEKYTDIGEQATQTNLCNNLVFGRACYEDACPENMRQASTPPGGWTDCERPKICCEPS